MIPAALLRGLLVAGLTGPAAFAQVPATGDPGPGQYAIEVLVFRHADAPADDAGDAAHPGPERDHDPAIAGSDGSTTQPDLPAAAPPQELSYTLLPDGEFKLADLAERLRASGNWEPLLHTGWIQDSFPVGTGPAFEVGRTHAGRPELTGTIRFSHGRYPHLELDLVYLPQDAGGSRIQRLNENRRLRDDDVNYFDHAHFGVIARVTPWPPETDPAGGEAPATALIEPR